jgi:putative FmdB family regulatory protein
MYPYRCTQCGHRFEKIQSFKAEPEKVCPQCGAPVERVLTAPRLSFKGAGWYVNDYAPKSGGSSSDSGSESGPAEKKGETKSEAKTETKSDAKPAAAPAKELSGGGGGETGASSSGSSGSGSTGSGSTASGSTTS